MAAGACRLQHLLTAMRQQLQAVTLTTALQPAQLQDTLRS
jgi:hypothetical protein